jgi:hypothetical protein
MKSQFLVKVFKKIALLIIAIFTLTILISVSQAQTNPLSKAKPIIIKVDNANINSDFQEYSFYNDVVNISGTGEPNSLIIVKAIPNDTICNEVKVSVDGKWSCNTIYSFGVSSRNSIKAVQDNEPQNFGNTVVLVKNGGGIFFNIYIDNDNNGLSNC